MFHLNEMFNLWCWLLKCDKTQENSFTNGEDLIEIWDKAHYYEEEKKKGKDLSVLARFRVRQK